LLCVAVTAHVTLFIVSAMFLRDVKQLSTTSPLQDGDQPVDGVHSTRAFSSVIIFTYEYLSHSYIWNKSWN